MTFMHVTGFNVTGEHPPKHSSFHHPPHPKCLPIMVIGSEHSMICTSQIASESISEGLNIHNFPGGA